MNDFTVLILPGANASSVATTLDVLAAAAATASRAGASAPRWRVLCAGGASAPLSNGMSVKGAALPARVRSEHSVWIVPGLGLTHPKALAQRFTEPDALRAIAALRAHARAGGAVAASCSAVFLLQAAGLLAGRKVTTSWWLAPLLHRLAPGCTVDADRMVIEDGPLVTAGAAMAQTDLMLHLVRTRFGVALADAVARVLLIDARAAQAPFVVPEMMAMGNELVARITARVEAGLPHAPCIEELAMEFAMSARTLARHVKAATGRSPLALVQSVRLNKARALLENSKLSVDEVALRVGYEDATALRRLMRKATGATPRQFRANGREGRPAPLRSSASPA
ncbi:MAG TPA: helix-turn-helix domain-containing protein [Noviherbaspirillum sp.]|nr:helix-turn-helix domain-containing protein [Noviherbaspirillum sp.]